MPQAAPQPTSRTINISGLNFHYVNWGGVGTPIILIHGLASTVHIWDLVAPRLTAYGHVIALDQRGHGLTDQPATGYDFATITADLANFVHALGIQEKFFLVGHSWGAHVALCFAQRYGEMLRGAVLVDGGIMDFKTQWPTWAGAEKHMTPPALTAVTLPEIRHRIKEQWLGNAWTPETGELALSVYKVDEQGFVHRRLDTANHLQIAHAIWALTPAELFPQIKCPVLLAAPIPPGMAQQPDAWQVEKQKQVQQAEQLLNQGQVVWFPETIHDVPWQRPEQLANTINEFITKHLAAKVMGRW
ncbi:MAG: alpha/beta hydrolase [Caldilineaceae bacterium]